MKTTFRTKIDRELFTDVHTGEILTDVEHKKVIKTVVTKGDFYQVYTGYLAAWLGLKPAECVSVLSWLAANVDYGTNTLDLTKRKKEQLCKDLNIGIASFYNYWKVLKKATFINEDDKEEYLISADRTFVSVNPKIAWKGSISDLHSISINMSCRFLVKE